MLVITCMPIREPERPSVTNRLLPDGCPSRLVQCACAFAASPQSFICHSPVGSDENVEFMCRHGSSTARREDVRGSHVDRPSLKGNPFVRHLRPQEDNR